MISIDLAFVFQFVNFLLLMLLLNIFLYKPVRKMLAERESEIIASREKTASVDREVQEKMALYELKLRQTKTVAYEEKASAIGKAREEESAIVGKARQEAVQTLAVIQKQIAREAEDARRVLREEAQSLSLEICRKVLGRSL